MAIRFTVQVPAYTINQLISTACHYTARETANDYIHYLLLRFSEKKHGRRYFAPGRGWYTTSAPGEYPAIKYGILYRAMGTRTRWRTPNGAGVTVGAAAFPGNSYGVRRNDPDYAMELEGLEGTGPMRPYFIRAFLETSPTRPQYARAHFLSYLYGRATAFNRGRGPVQGIQIGHSAGGGLGGDAMALLPALGTRSLATIAAAVRAGQYVEVFGP